MHTHQQTTAATNDNIVNSPINRVCADVKEEATRSRPWREASDARAATRWTTARRRRWTWAAARAYPAVVTSHRGAATKGRYSSCRSSKVIICLFIYVCLYIWACVCVCCMFCTSFSQLYLLERVIFLLITMVVFSWGVSPFPFRPSSIHPPFFLVWLMEGVDEEDSAADDGIFL